MRTYFSYWPMRARLLATLFLPLCALALAVGGGGAWAIHIVVQNTNDRLLGGSLRSIGDTLGLEDGQLTLDLPPSALCMLDNSDRDNVYYSVRLANQLVTGYSELPIVDPRNLSLNQPNFRTALFHGQPIRVATEARLIPRLRAPVVVQVAETMRNRQDLEFQMLIGLASAEALLLLAVVSLTWVAVGWGLKPLSLLRQEVEKRTARGGIDFRPLPVRPAPSEVGAFVGAFNSLFHELEGAVNSLRRFTSDASHQMRTPLAILRTHVQLLGRYEAKTSATRTIIDGIETAVKNLQRLLVQLIALARAEEATDEIKTAQFDLGDLVVKVAREHVDKALQVGVNLSFDNCSPEPAVVRGDPLLAGEIVANIIDNAIRYNHPGGSVWLKVNQAGQLEVEDDGPGIPPAEKDRVFERFYRIQRDTVQEGSGLGLSIVRALADRIGASVKLEDAQIEKGLRVRVEFGAIDNSLQPERPS